MTLSLANWRVLGVRGRICAVQQSSIFTRVSLARLVNEVWRIRAIDRVTARLPGRAAAWVRAALEFCFRRSQICLGHHQFVRLDVLQALGGFPTAGATEDSTLGYMLGARGILIRPMPMIELTDLPETKEKIIRQNARWYQGVLDDVAYLWAAWRAAQRVQPRPVRPPRRQQGRGVAGRRLRLPGDGVPRLALRLCVPTGAPAPLPRRRGGAHGVPGADRLGRGRGDPARGAGDGAVSAPAHAARVGALERGLLATFRCQTYWLLATRAAWRVLWRTARDGRYEPSKTDRATRGEARRRRSRGRGSASSAATGWTPGRGATAGATDQAQLAHPVRRNQPPRRRSATADRPPASLASRELPPLDSRPPLQYRSWRTAGWSSPVARWAHNPKVAGSNPAPATNKDKGLGRTALAP